MIKTRLNIDLVHRENSADLPTAQMINEKNLDFA